MRFCFTSFSLLLLLTVKVIAQPCTQVTQPLVYGQQCFKSDSTGYYSFGVSGGNAPYTYTVKDASNNPVAGVSVSFMRRSGEHDQLFGSVTSGDIADALAKKGFDLDRRKIQIHEPLKTVGEFTVPVKLHKDVTTHLKVVIEKEAAE